VLRLVVGLVCRLSGARTLVSLVRYAEKEAEQLQAWRLQGAGKPGTIGDGFGQLYSTLEDFPYEKYGIRIP
jgi:hypothetical protein